MGLEQKLHGLTKILLGWSNRAAGLDQQCQRLGARGLHGWSKAATRLSKSVTGLYRARVLQTGLENVWDI
jgi:hypothetical protein